MPNTPVWGNAAGSQHNDQDLISAAGSGSIIEVKNVNIDATQRIGLKSTNTNTGENARALYTEGQVELVAGRTGDPPITAVKVYNPSTDDYSRALWVTGRSDIGVQLANDVDDATKQALNVMGNTHLQSYTGENAAHKTLEVVNSNTNSNARALYVEGMAEVIGKVGMIQSTGLKVINNDRHLESLALHVHGDAKFEKRDDEAFDLIIQVANAKLLCRKEAQDDLCIIPGSLGVGDLRRVIICNGLYNEILHVVGNTIIEGGNGHTKVGYSPITVRKTQRSTPQTYLVIYRPKRAWHFRWRAENRVSGEMGLKYSRLLPTPSAILRPRP